MLKPQTIYLYYCSYYFVSDELNELNELNDIYSLYIYIYIYIYIYNVFSMHNNHHKLRVIVKLNV